MHGKIVAGMFLALGTADLAAQNLVLVPGLPRAGAGASALVPMALRRAVRAERARAPEEPGADAAVEVEAASMKAAPTAAGPEPRPAAVPSPAAPDILFSFDSVRIEQRAALVDLQRVVHDLAAEPGRRLVLRGHSDPLGLPAQNLDLSWRRAAAVKQYLVWRGAPAERITVEALGDAEPADPGRTPHACARDRRVELLWR
jgi:outer membrane protein OmpA-like peptidoglycan-associated protein